MKSLLVWAMTSAISAATLVAGGENGVVEGSYEAFRQNFGDTAPFELQEYQKAEKWFRLVPGKRLRLSQSKLGKITYSSEGALAEIKPGTQWQASYAVGPRKLYPGDKLRLSYRITPADLKVTISAVLKDGTYFVWGQEHLVPLDAGNKTVDAAGRVTIELDFPDDVAGKYLSELSFELTASTAEPAQLELYEMSMLRRDVDNTVDADKILSQPRLCRAKVGMYQGVMTLFLDGRPSTSFGFQSMIPQQYGNYDAMLNQTGYGITRLGITLGEDVYHFIHPATWVGPRQFDFTFVDEMLGKLIDLKPDNKVILTVVLDGATWWTLKNPDAAGMSWKQGIPDYLSMEWRRDARFALRQLIAHLESGPFAGKVIGYELFGGSSLDCNFEVNDRSPGALKRFQDFLREKYGKVSALQKAWNDRTVTFETAVPEHLVTDRHPLAEMDTPLLLNASGRQAFLDSRRFRQDTFQTTILDFARWVKEATQGGAIAGARTGDFMGNMWAIGGVKQEVSENDMNPVDLLCKSPDFDFFDVQEPYLGRHHIGDQSTGTPIIPIKGLAMDNKLAVIQDDVPHLVDRTPDPKSDAAYLVSMKRRTFVYSLIDGLGVYQWEMGHYHLDIPFLLEEFKKQREIADRAICLPRQSVAEVAIVMDRDYQRFTGTDPVRDMPARTAALFDHVKWTWARAGAPVDIIFLDQLKQAPPYKVYVFMHVFGPDNEEVKLIKKTLSRNHAVGVFSWADGYCMDGGFDLAQMNDLVGMNISASSTERSWKMSPAAWFTEKYPVSEAFPLGTLADTEPSEKGAADWMYAPSFTVRDRDAQALGYYPGTKDVAAAVKDQSGYTTIYSASPILSPALLRYAFDSARVHRFTDTEDALYINQSLLGLHAKDTHDIEVRFQSPVALYDLFSDREYPAAQSQRISVEAGKTYMFFRGTRAEWMGSLPDSASVKSTENP